MFTGTKQIQRRKRQLIITGAVVVLVLGLCYLYVWQRVYTLKLSEEHARHRRTVQQLEEKCRELKIEIVKLSSMQRIEGIASHQLKLFPLQERQVISSTDLLGRRLKKTFTADKSGKSFPSLEQSVVHAEDVD